MNLYKFILFVTGFLLVPLSYGHHSPARFNTDNIIPIQGEVVRVAWRNPHVYVYINISNTDGQLIEWQLEATATPVMGRAGWTRSTLSVGDNISALINPARSPNSKNGLLVSLTTENGITLGVDPGYIPRGIAASNISGIWDANAGFDLAIQQFATAPKKLTDRALGEEMNLTSTDNKVKNCIPMSIPLFTILNYLNEIEILTDRVLIKSEYFSVDRIIYTDGREHPANGETSNQGHSIGYWEGDNLIVDTQLFDGDMVSSVRGIQTVDLQVQEKYILSDDKTQLFIEITVADPELLLEPYTVSTIWDYAPNGDMNRWKCDPENATLFDF